MLVSFFPKISDLYIDIGADTRFAFSSKIPLSEHTIIKPLSASVANQSLAHLTRWD